MPARRSGRTPDCDGSSSYRTRKEGEDGDREARGKSSTETVLGQSNTDPYAEDHREILGQYRPPWKPSSPGRRRDSC